MGFFDSLGSALGGIGSIVGTVAPIIGQIANRPRSSDAPAVAQLGQQSQAANQAARAAIDPNDPMYRNLVRLEEESGRVDIAKAVNEHMRQRKRMMHRLGGRRYEAWFNPEREDEGMSQAISREGIEVGNRARKTARDTLLQSSAAQSGQLNATANLAQLQNQQATQRSNYGVNMGNLIGQGGRTLADSDWIKALTNQMQYNQYYGPPGYDPYTSQNYYG